MRDHVRPPEPVTLDELLVTPDVTCVLSDALGRTGALDLGVRWLSGNGTLVGAAYTARPFGHDLTAVFDAIDHAPPHSVLVIDARSCPPTAVWGENMALSALNRRVRGVVIDGVCRDITALRDLNFPVLARGCVPNAGRPYGHGEHGVPTQCGGQVVHPDDLIVGDDNGVVIVPHAQLGAVLKRAAQLLARQRVTQAALQAGATIGELNRRPDPAERPSW